MEKIRNKINSGSVVTSVMCLIVGIIFCVWPTETITTLSKLVGGIIMLVAVVLLILAFTLSGRQTKVGYFVPGIICFLFGSLILTKPGFFLTWIPVVVGLVMVYHGIKNLIFTKRMVSAGSNRWWSAIIIAVLTLALGLLLIFCAWKAVQIAMMVIGLVLIYDGISGLFLNGKSAGALRKKKRSNPNDPIDVDYKEV